MKAAEVSEKETEALSASHGVQDGPVLKRLKKKSKYIGIGYAFLSSVLMSIQFILIKKANYLSGSEITTMRYALQIIGMLSIAKYKGEAVFGPRELRWTLVFRGVLGAIGMLSVGFAVKLRTPSHSCTQTSSSRPFSLVYFSQRSSVWRTSSAYS